MQNTTRPPLKVRRPLRFFSLRDIAKNNVAKNNAAKKYGVFPPVFLILALALMLRSYPIQAADRVSKPSPQMPSLAVLYDAIAPQLYAGNLTVYFVPFHTRGEDQIDTPDWWKHCPFSKAVSEQGMHEAATVSRAISTLNIPIGLVRSSELCSALSTATFVVGNPAITVYVTPDLNPVEIQKLFDRNEQIVRALVAAHFTAGWKDSITILSGFQLPPLAAPHPVLSDLQNGESAIFRTLPGAQLELVARLNWRQWEQMAEYIKYRALNASRTKKK